MSDDFPSDDDVLVILEVDEEGTEYSLTVRAANGSPISDHDFIMHIEAWLHDVSKAEITRREPGTSIH